MAKMSNDLIAARLELLEQAKAALESWLKNQLDRTEYYEDKVVKEKRRKQDEARTTINRNLHAIKQAVRDANVPTGLTINGPLTAGGRVHSLDLLNNVFEPFYLESLVPRVVWKLDEAIGVYTHLSKETGLVDLTTRDTMDVTDAIDRALRPAFGKTPPNDEREIQAAINTILCALGVAFTRDQETAPVGVRASKPDFVLTDLNTALEVKFTNEKHSESKVQEEIQADIPAYRTRWKHLVFVIYDVGVITDPERMRRENQKHFGVSVRIVKH